LNFNPPISQAKACGYQNNFFTQSEMGLPIKKERLFFVGEIHELPLQSFRELDVPPVIDFQ
jgi:hypothetical protein